MSGMMAMMASNVQQKTVIAAAAANLIYNLDAATFTGLSANFSGAATTYLESSQSAAINGDFTVEAWYYPTNVTGTHSLFTLGPDPANRYTFALVGTSVTSNLYGFGSTTYTSTVPINTWTHIAVVRSGSTVKVYINGTASVTTDTQSGRIGNGTVNIGADAVGGALFVGNISNFRLVSSAVYTSNFTPSTTALTNITGTQLLLLLNSLPFVDSSSNATAVTIYNSVSLKLSSPFSPIKDSTGTYTITQNIGSSISWDSSGGGSFAKSNSTGTDYIYGGPNYATGQSYSVFMAYKLSSTSAGRLLNTQNETVKDWLMGAYNGNPNTFYPNVSVNLPSTGADTVWHLDFATWDTSTTTGKLYTSTTTAPSNAAFTTTNAGGGGFNQLRLFSRASGSEVQSGNIAFVKVYDGVLDLSTIQSLHATYKSRFGY
jgi:hypothetical protein